MDHLPAASPLLVEILFLRNPQAFREILHVQSISHWAPACIGPYSQASTFQIGCLRLTLLAGMIGLDPSSMLLAGTGQPENSVSCQTTQILSNLFRVMTSSQCSLSRLDSIRLQEKTEEEEEEKEGNVESVLSVGFGSNILHSTIFINEESRPFVDQIMNQVNEWMEGCSVQPVVDLVFVPALPKRANVELQISAYTSTASSKDSLDDDFAAASEKIWVDRRSATFWTCYSLSSPILSVCSSVLSISDEELEKEAFMLSAISASLSPKLDADREIRLRVFYDKNHLNLSTCMPSFPPSLLPPFLSLLCC